MVAYPLLCESTHSWSLLSSSGSYRSSSLERIRRCWCFLLFRTSCVSGNICARTCYIHQTQIIKIYNFQFSFSILAINLNWNSNAWLISPPSAWPQNITLGYIIKLQELHRDDTSCSFRSKMLPSKTASWPPEEDFTGCETVSGTIKIPSSCLYHLPILSSSSESESK